MGFPQTKYQFKKKKHIRISNLYGSYRLSIRMCFSHTEYIINQEQYKNEEEEDVATKKNKHQQATYRRDKAQWTSTTNNKQQPTKYIINNCRNSNENLNTYLEGDRNKEDATTTKKNHQPRRSISNEAMERSYEKGRRTKNKSKEERRRRRRTKKTEEEDKGRRRHREKKVNLEKEGEAKCCKHNDSYGRVTVLILYEKGEGYFCPFTRITGAPNNCQSRTTYETQNENITRGNDLSHTMYMCNDIETWTSYKILNKSFPNYFFFL